MKTKTNENRRPKRNGGTVRPHSGQGRLIVVKRMTPFLNCGLW